MTKQQDRERFLEHDVHMSSRTHTVFGEFDAKLVASTIKALTLLDLDNDSPIKIIMCSPGGEDYVGYAVYDTIKGCRSSVTIEVRGYAMSIAVLVLQAADHRVSTPYSRLMIHPGTITLPEVKAQELFDEARETAMLERRYEDVLFAKIREKNPKFPRKKFSEMLKKNTYFSALEALNLGLIDEVIE